jgi:hypothetical protein
MAHALGVKNAALTFSGDIIEMNRSKDLRALRGDLVFRAICGA